MRDLRDICISATSVLSLPDSGEEAKKRAPYSVLQLLTTSCYTVRMPDHFLLLDESPCVQASVRRSQRPACSRIDWSTDLAQPRRQGGWGLGSPVSGLLLLVKRLYEVGCPLPLMRSLLGERVQQVFGLEEREVFIPPFDGLDQSSLFSAKAYPFDSFSILR